MFQQTPQSRCLDFITLFSIIHVHTRVNILCWQKCVQQL